jgi:hypothetical protein
MDDFCLYALLGTKCKGHFPIFHLEAAYDGMTRSDDMHEFTVSSASVLRCHVHHWNIDNIAIGRQLLWSSWIRRRVFPSDICLPPAVFRVLCPRLCRI